MATDEPTIQIVLGLDVGTSDSKVLATTTSGAEICSVSAPTAWRSHGDCTDIDPELLYRDVSELLDQVVRVAGNRVGPVTVGAIAVTGMAEAGVLLDDAGRASHPVIAWFDPRGGTEIQALSVDMLAEFSGRTGLPVSPMATITKLAWMRTQGTVLRGRQWLNVPEYIAHRLGAVRASELSLASRTGLLDQDSSRPWPAALAAIDADADLIPPLVVAGTPLGRAGGLQVPPALHGAVLTVAGHDHPVAAVGAAATGTDGVVDSFGTAEALVRSTAGRLDMAARDRLARGGVNAMHHVLAGRRLLLGATKAGLLLRRTLDMLGAAGGDRRSELDQAACALQSIGEPGATPVAGVEVWGAANDDGTLRVNVTGNEVGPAAVWLAAVANGIDEAARVLEQMADEAGPARAVVVAGGWSRMTSVRRAKMAALQDVRFSDRTQAGAFGATMFAAHAAVVAEALLAAGDDSANCVAAPTGPTEDFAARYTSPAAATPPGKDAAPAGIAAAPGGISDLVAGFDGRARPYAEVTVR